MASRLFQPLALGAIELPNRFLLAPVKTALGKPGGLSTDKHVAYYVRRVTGGTGTIITEPLYVDPRGKEHPKQLGIDGDDKLEGLRTLAEAVHGAGGKVLAHINHGGRAANPKAAGATPEAPSAVPCPVTGATPEAMTADRVREVAGEFIAAAQRAVKAGFDGVELQLGLGYMVAQFWSPRTNKRTDEYGGTKENRARFLRDVVTGVRAALGADKALLVRVSAEEKVPEGMGLQDAVEIAKLAKELGADGIHVVTGSACDTPPWYYQHMSLPQGVNEKLAAKIREAVGGPVIVAGRMSDPDKLQALIDSGNVDGFGLGRPLLADPDLPNKVRDGRAAQIQLCGACLQGCLLKVKGGGPISCLANPEVGHETETLAKTDAPKHVVIVGGGPAGLQAAITASERGHKVTLLEKDTLGGQFALAFLSPGKAAMKRTYDAMLRRAKASGAAIREHTEATVEGVMALSADEVFVATGSEPVRIPIPGLEGAFTGGQILTDSVDAGKRVLVLGGGLIGIEVAEHLAEKGAEVTVVEMLEEFARDMEPVTRKLTLMRLGKMPVTIHTSTKLVSFANNEAVVSAKQGESSLGKFDSAVVAVGSRPVNALADALKSKGVKVTVIGDAIEAGQVWDATQSGFTAASTL